MCKIITVANQKGGVAKTTEYSGRCYTTCPVVGNRHSTNKETAIPVAETIN